VLDIDPANVKGRVSWDGQTFPDYLSFLTFARSHLQAKVILPAQIYMMGYPDE